jgi:hypothetical protein
VLRHIAQRAHLCVTLEDGRPRHSFAPLGQNEVQLAILHTPGQHQENTGREMSPSCPRDSNSLKVPASWHEHQHPPVSPQRLVRVDFGFKLLAEERRVALETERH